MSKELKKEWLSNPYTMELLDSLRTNMEVIREGWASGSFTGSQSSETLQLNAQAIGQHNALNDIVNYILDLNIEEKLDEQQYH